MSEFLPFSCRASEDPEYQQVVYLYAAVLNKHVFAELREMPEAEQKEALQILKDRMIEMSH